MNTQVALCFIIVCICTLLGFLTFGLQAAICNGGTAVEPSDAFFDPSDHNTPQSPFVRGDVVIIRGIIYDFNDIAVRVKYYSNLDLTSDFVGRDISKLFLPEPDYCSQYLSDKSPYNCTIYSPLSPLASPIPANSVSQKCPSFSEISGSKQRGKIFFNWNEIATHASGSHSLFVFNGGVINVTSYLSNPFITNSDVVAKLPLVLGHDGTKQFYSTDATLNAARCLNQKYLVGFVDKETPGCFASNLVLTISLVVILGVVLTRFVMAIVFSWFLSQKLTKPPTSMKKSNLLSQPGSSFEIQKDSTYSQNNQSFLPKNSRYSSNPYLAESQTSLPLQNLSNRSSSSVTLNSPSGSIDNLNDDSPMTILFVTCYSEGVEGIRATLSSLAGTDYPDKRKLLFVVADGIIQGHGNDRSTPDIIVEMLTQDPKCISPEAKTYIAIADGVKQHNMAKVVSCIFF